MEIELVSTITCPGCGHTKEEEMPTTACQFFYQCDNCKHLLKPKEGNNSSIRYMYLKKNRSSN